MTITVCDKCKNQFIAAMEEELIKDNISKVFFTCPHCDKEYLIHYTDTLIKIKRDKINKLKERYNKAFKVDRVKAKPLYKKYEKLKREIGKDMDNLEERVLSWEK